MKYGILLLFVLLIGCKPVERIVNVCEPDTVRVYVSQVDTTITQYGRTYIRAYDRGIELRDRQIRFLEQAAIPDSLRHAMQTAALNQFEDYIFRLATEVQGYFEALLFQGRKETIGGNQ